MYVLHDELADVGTGSPEHLVYVNVILDRWDSADDPHVFISHDRLITLSRDQYAAAWEFGTNSPYRQYVWNAFHGTWENLGMYYPITFLSNMDRPFKIRGEYDDDKVRDAASLLVATPSLYHEMRVPLRERLERELYNDGMQLMHEHLITRPDVPFRPFVRVEYGTSRFDTLSATDRVRLYDDALHSWEGKIEEAICRAGRIRFIDNLEAQEGFWFHFLKDL